MKHVRRMLFSLILISNMLLCGCWNYHDIEKYSLVLGFAIDRNEQENSYLLTAEVLDFEMSGKEAKPTSKLIESKGNSVFDAIRNMLKLTEKRLYWGHADTVIFSQDIAKEGIIPVLDLIFRDAEMREEMHVVISKEKTAKELLEQQTMISTLRSTEIDRILNSQGSLAKAPVVEAYELINELEGEGISAALPAMGIATNAGKKTVELMGTALFKSDKLIGFIDSEETKYFLFVINKVNRGLLIQNESPENQMNKITLEIFKTKTKTKPEYYDGKVVMDIDIKTEVAIAEMETSMDYIKDVNRSKLKKDAEASLKSSVKNIIKKIQDNYDTDIFGFGMLVSANMPSLWDSIGPDWDHLFKKLDVNVNVDISIRNSALVSKSIRKESIRKEN
ncbi:MAG: Ger(x)C family spore germination protein [Bacillota bacterium]|nr:Ger(x)C family spore germination protein [Bacillota bacterium]